MKDDRDNRIYLDENGERWLTDESGNILTDEFGNKIAPTQALKNSKDGEFTTFDMSQGHCGLCGSISCHGGCFK
jgi:hypothetical protein